MLDISQQQIEVSCPACATKQKVILKQVEAQETIVCSGCKKNILLTDKNGSVKKAVHDVNKSINGLMDTIKNFGK